MSIVTLAREEEYTLPDDALIAEGGMEDSPSASEDQEMEEGHEAEQAMVMHMLDQSRNDALRNVREIVQTPSGPKPKYPYPFGYKDVEYGETD